MTQTEIERLQKLRQKEQLTEKEFAQWEFLEKKVINDERIEQFRKNQQEPYSSKRSRAVNLAWEFFRAVDQVPVSMFALVAEPSSGPPRKFMFSVGNVKWPLKNRSDNQ